jgi:hypothetical protein
VVVRQLYLGCRLRRNADADMTDRVDPLEFFWSMNADREQL